MTFFAQSITLSVASHDACSNGSRESVPPGLKRVRGRRGVVLTSERTGESATLRDYLLVARRRKWIILQAVVLVPAAAVAFSLVRSSWSRA